MLTFQQQALQHHLRLFAQLSDEDLQLAHDFWLMRTIPTREYFNFRNSVCRHVGFIVKGLFRVYYIDPQTAEEQNLFFAAENLFLTSLKSMLSQTACPYNIEALEDAELMVIEYEHLQSLYTRSHGWERFGRLLAEQYLVINQSRAESLLTQSAEERYRDLISHSPDFTNRISLGHIASYLGIKGPSLSRIRAQAARKG